MKKNIWRRIFVLPFISTLLVMVVAAALMALAFQWRLFDLRGAVIYMFATYALIVACTGYARLMERIPILKRIFTLPLLPSLLIIISGAALLIYVFSQQSFGNIAWFAYPLSAYALILAITNYIRMMRELSASDHQILIGGYKSQYRVKSKALNGLFASILIPFFQVVVISFSYVMTQSVKGAVTGKAGRIILAVISVIAMLLMVVLGPLFFWVGVACVLWWSGQAVRGIALCAVGLVLIVLSAHIIRRMTAKQKAEILRDFHRV